MRLVLWTGVLTTAAAVGYFGVQPYVPEDYSGYLKQKAAQSTAEVGPVVRQSAPPVTAEAAAQRRADFKVFRSRVPKPVAWYLDQVFSIADAAAVEWRAASHALSEGRKPFLMNENYAAILGRLKGMKTPAGLLPFEGMLAQAIDAQWRYLKAWQQSGQHDFQDRNRDMAFDIRDRLAGAYSYLMAAFPDEDRHNQKAFRDHLNGLDFLS